MKTRRFCFLAFALHGSNSSHLPLYSQASAPKPKAAASVKKGEGKADNKKSTGASVKPKKKAAPTPDENNAGESDDDAMNQDPPGSSSDVDTRPPPKKAAPKNATEQYQKAGVLAQMSRLCCALY